MKIQDNKHIYQNSKPLYYLTAINIALILLQNMKFKRTSLAIMVMLLMSPCLKEPQRQVDLLPDYKVVVQSMTELRRMGHSCGWKDGYCCHDDNTDCYKCTGSPFYCKNGSYTTGIFAPDCGKKAGCTNIGNCTLTQNGSSSSVTVKRLTGNATVLIANTSTLFTAPAICGGGYDCNLVRTGGVNMDSCLTTTGTAQTMNTNTCSSLGTGKYNYTCTNYMKYKAEAPFTVTLKETCSDPGDATSQLPVAVSKNINDGGGSVTSSALLSSFIQTVSPCAMSSCSVTTATSTTCKTTNVAYFTGSLTSTTQVSLVLDTSVTQVQAFFCLQCTSNQLDGKQFYSNPFTVEVGCVVQTFTHTVPSYLKWTNIPVDGEFPVDPFTHAVPGIATGCPITKISIFTDMISNVSPPSMTPANFGITQPYSRVVFKGTMLVKHIYDFYIKVEYTGGYFFWAEIAGNNKFQLEVACGPSSTTVTDGTLLASFINTQTIDRNDPGGFILPSFSSTVAQCPVLKYYVTDSITGISVPATFVQDGIETGAGSGVFIVRPSDSSIDMTYQFYIKAEAEGGAFVFSSELMTLHVGCVPHVIKVTESKSFLKHKTLYIGDTNSSIYDIVDPDITPTYCNVYQQGLENREDLGTSDISVVEFSNLCSGAKYCQKLDSKQLNNVSTYKFQVKYFITTQTTFQSSFVTLDVICGPNAASYSPKNMNRTFSYIQYNIHKLTFPPFICTFSVCCDLVYTITSTNNSASPSPYSSQPTWVQDINNTNGGYYQIEPYTGSVMNYNFYIRIENKLGGNVFFSQEFQVDIKYNCSFDTLNHNPIFLKKGEKPEYLFFDNLNLTTPQNRSSQAWLYLNYTIFQYDNVSFSVADRLWTNASKECPVEAYFIEKVIDSDTGKQVSRFDLQGKLEMFTNGTMHFNGIYSARNLLVFGSVSNGLVRLTNAQPMLRVRAVPFKKVAINHPPFFALKFKSDYQVNITYQQEEKQEYMIPIPPVLDANQNDTFDISFEPNLQYIYFDNQTGMIVFNVTMFLNSEDKQLSFNMYLYDNNGGRNIYQMKFNLFEDRYFPKPVFEFKEKPSFVPRKYSGQNVTSFISSISVFGEMEVEFNGTMNTNFSRSLMNISLVDMYIEPYNRNETYNMSLLNFTWNLTQVFPSSFWFKLNFSHPYEISPFSEQDTLVMHIKNETQVFYSTEVRDNLHESTMIMRIKLRKLIKDTPNNRSVIAQSSTAGESTVGFLVMAFLLYFLGQGRGQKYYMWYIRAAQIVVHLPMHNTPMPGVCVLMFEKLIPVVQFDILDADWTTELVLEYDEEQHRYLESQILDQMINIGYETHSSIRNLGSLWLFLLFWILMVIVYWGGSAIKRLSKDRYKLKFLKKLSEAIFFSYILGVCIDGFMEWIIAWKMNLLYPLYDKIGDKLSTFTIILCILVSMIMIPLFQIFLLMSSLESYKDPSFSLKFGFFFKDIRIDKKWSANYFLVWLIRRILYLANVFYMAHLPGIQLIFLFYTNLVALMYASTSPYTDMYLNRHGMFEEMIIQLVSLHFVLFTEYVDTEENKATFGWSLSSIILTHLLYQIILLSYMLLISLYLILRKIKTRFLWWYDTKMGQDQDAYLRLIKKLGLKLEQRQILSNDQLSSRKLGPKIQVNSRDIDQPEESKVEENKRQKPQKVKKNLNQSPQNNKKSKKIFIDRGKINPILAFKDIKRGDIDREYQEYALKMESQIQAQKFTTPRFGRQEEPRKKKVEETKVEELPYWMLKLESTQKTNMDQQEWNRNLNFSAELNNEPKRVNDHFSTELNDEPKRVNDHFSTELNDEPKRVNDLSEPQAAANIQKTEVKIKQQIYSQPNQFKHMSLKPKFTKLYMTKKQQETLDKREAEKSNPDSANTKPRKVNASKKWSKKQRAPPK